jgi:hypothetical protein
VPLGDADGVAEGEGVVWVPHWFSVPCRKISSPPHPFTMPEGCEYQSRMLLGRPFTK